MENIQRLSMGYWLNSRIRRLFSAERGVSLVEVLIAVAILTIGTTAFLSAFSTSSLAIRQESRRVTANSLAISQIHDTRSQSYLVAPSSYSTISDAPQGYSLTSDATAIAGKDDNIQKITVTVKLNGRTITVLEEYKVNR